MPARWSSDRPISRQEFQALFPDDAACAEYLVDKRWPEGFSCPACGGQKAWALDRKRPTWECAGCRRQTSVTAGTIMHRSHLPLKTWFLAAHIVATHSNGISALQLQGQLGIGSYKTAWLLLQKLQRGQLKTADLAAVLHRQRGDQRAGEAAGALDRLDVGVDAGATGRVVARDDKNIRSH